MGLYDDRLSDFSESRRNRRVAQRGTSSVRPARQSPSFGGPRSHESPSKAPSMSAQSLLFKRDEGWTESKAKAWAKANGYRYGSVDVTDQYIRIRQFDPKGTKVKRTIPFGRGIRAVVAREEMKSMATTRKSHRSRPAAKKRKRKATTTARKAPKRRRKARKVTAVAAPKRRRRRAKVTARKAPRRRRRSSHVMEAKRAPRRRRRRVTREAWKGNPEGHAKAAKKGWRRKKAKRAAPKRRRAKRRARETVYAAAPRRRRHRRARASSHVMEAKRTHRRRSYRARAKSSSSGMSAGELALAVFSGGVGFVIADGVDRFLATYNPASTDAPPTDRFTSSGAGTLANTLNVAATPNWKRLAAGAATAAAPAIGSMYVDHPMVKSSLEGMAIGAGVSLFKTLWNNVLMPLLSPKDTSPASLQKSYIARLYPAEVAAHINMKQTPPTQQVSSSGSGALSDGPAQTAAQAPVGVSAPADVGPFALSDSSPYPDAAQALRARAGVSGDSPYPDAAQALRAGVSGDSPYESAASALRKQAGVSYAPGPPDGPGPGPQAAPHTAPQCGCIGEGDQFLGFIGDQSTGSSDTVDTFLGSVN